MTKDSLEQRVLVAAPTGRDADVLCRLLSEAGIDAVACPDIDALCREMREGAAAAILAEECLHPQAQRLLTETLADQPEWSDFPLIVMAGSRYYLERGWHWLTEANGAAHAVLLQRPVRRATILSSVRVALRSRRRQYQVRDELRQRQRMELTLRESGRTLERQVAERTAELRQQNWQLRRLAGQLTEAEQRERRKLATVLHDGLQQILVAGKVQISLCSAKGGEQAFKRLQDLLDEAIDASRSLSYELNPPALRNATLSAAIHWLADWFRDNHDFQVTVQQDDSDFLAVSDHIKTIVYQSVRELLLNSVKHSGGRSACVEFQRRRDEKLCIIVADDGKGFDLTRFDPHQDTAHGLGLTGIRERMTALGGGMEIDSRPGAGARFTLSLRLSDEP